MDKKLSNKIVRDIKQRILSGTLKTGDRLPAERELAENYNVSRITVRRYPTGILSSASRRFSAGTFCMIENFLPPLAVAPGNP